VYFNLWKKGREMSLATIDTKRRELTFEEAEKLKNESVWQSLDRISLEKAVGVFLGGLSKHTAESYRGAFGLFFRLRLLDPKMTLKGVALMNLEAKLDQIKETVPGKEATKQARVAAFVSFTGFLQRRTQGLIHKAVPNKEKGKKSFIKIREKSGGDTLSRMEVEGFLGALRGVSLRNYLVAAVQLQGAKRISEVLEARIEDIDWNTGAIRFRQKKSDVLEKTTTAFYPKAVMEDLKSYLEDREEGLIFITRTGKGLSRFEVRAFYQAGYKRAGIKKRGLSHMLRATTITELARRGFHPEEIATLSGHSSMAMVSYYDHSAEERNPSKRFSMV
jgi:integrase/recombinase XerD